MNLNEFISSLNENSPHENLNPLLTALWYDAKGEWDKSHKITQNINGIDAAWVHAYLHRKEGDSGNARYWYSRAAKPFPNKTLEDEWNDIVNSLLNNKD